MTFKEFQAAIQDSWEAICLEVFFRNRDRIRVKKESTAIRNFRVIFNAVFRISSQKGFQAMTMRDLSRETGMSLGALYSYFTGKEDLLAIIQQQGRAMVRRVLAQCLDGRDNPLDRLRALIRGHLYLSEAARPWFYFTFMEARNLKPDQLDKVIEMETYTETLISDILVQGEKDRIFKPGDHRLTASIIKAMQQDWYLKHWKYARRSVAVEAYADRVLEFVETTCLTDLGQEARRRLNHGDH